MKLLALWNLEHGQTAAAPSPAESGAAPPPDAAAELAARRDAFKRAADQARAAELSGGR